jgi:GNAT superfamily N-acetyltransferase
VSGQRTRREPRRPARGFRVRPATAADIPGLVELRLGFDVELAGPLPADRAAEHRAQVADYLTSHVPDGRFLVWVAEAGGSLVGMAGLVIVDRPPHPRSSRSPEAFVFNVYTVPAWRGRGVATAIMDALIAHARERHARRVILRTSDDGRGVYERLGFRDPGFWLQLDLD